MTEETRCPVPNCQHVWSAHGPDGCKLIYCICRATPVDTRLGAPPYPEQFAALDAGVDITLCRWCDLPESDHPVRRKGKGVDWKCSEFEPMWFKRKLVDVLEIPTTATDEDGKDRLYAALAQAELNWVETELGWVDPDKFFPLDLLGEVLQMLMSTHTQRAGLLLAEKLNKQCGASARRRRLP